MLSSGCEESGHAGDRPRRESEDGWYDEEGRHSAEAQEDEKEDARGEQGSGEDPEVARRLTRARLMCQRSFGPPGRNSGMDDFPDQIA